MCITHRNLNDSTNIDLMSKYNVDSDEYLKLTKEVFPELSKNSYITETTSSTNQQ